jgi:hypothetical protein
MIIASMVYYFSCVMLGGVHGAFGSSGMGCIIELLLMNCYCDPFWVEYTGPLGQVEWGVSLIHYVSCVMLGGVHGA